MLKHFLTTFVILTSTAVFAQDISELKRSVSFYRAELMKAEDDFAKQAMNDSLKLAVNAFLKHPNSYTAKLDSIQYLGDLYSPDDNFRIVLWNVNNDDLSFTYYGYVQKKSKKRKQPNIVTELNDNSSSYFGKSVEYKTLKADNWYGALYYKIVPFKRRGKKHYAMLGWDGNDFSSNKKLIEVLSFNSKGVPTFGAPVFKGKGREKKRIIFQYTKDAYFLLKHDERGNRFIFDHLAPLKPQFEGIYEFYAPDMTHDAFTYKKGKWQFEGQINVRGTKSKIYHDPRLIKEPIDKTPTGLRN